MDVGDYQLISRTTQAGYAYWRRIQASRGYASRADIDPAGMVPFLPHVILIDVLAGPRDFRYRLIGTAIDRFMSKPYTGMRMSEIPHQRSPSKIWQSCETVVASGQPLAGAVPYVGPHRDIVRAEDVIMPLAGDAGDVAMLMVVVDYIYRSQLQQTGS